MILWVKKELVSISLLMWSSGMSVSHSLKCLSNSINQDYSAKSWNRYSHFSNLIHSKKKMFIDLTG